LANGRANLAADRCSAWFAVGTGVGSATDAALSAGWGAAGDGGTFLPDSYYEGLGSRAPTNSSPFDVQLKFDPEGNVRGATTYDQYGRRVNQYELGPSVRHGEGYHTYDNYGPGNADGVRSDHTPY
jgi:hypothetical protein